MIGETPLYHALKCKNNENRFLIVRELIWNGADVNIVNIISFKHRYHFSLLYMATERITYTEKVLDTKLIRLLVVNRAVLCPRMSKENMKRLKLIKIQIAQDKKAFETFFTCYKRIRKK